MNGKRAKEIRRHTPVVLVSWIQSLLDEKEAAEINIENYKNFLPVQTHFFANDTMYLNAYHPKWIVKKIRQLKKLFPRKKTTEINLELIQWKATKKQG